jgi:hypothetical protein
LDAKHGARHLGFDIKNYFLGTPMAYYQYMQAQQSVLPQEVWDGPRYDIQIAADGYVYLEIRRGMYRPPSLLSTSSFKNLHPLATNPYLSHQASGATQHSQRPLSSALMTLVSSTSPSPTPNI